MRLQQGILALTVSLACLAGPLAARADDGTGPPPVPRKEFCRENPGKCAEARQKRQEYCAANPEKCAEHRAAMKQKREARREFCKANPEKCAEQREQMKANRAELKAKCDADPARCEEMRREARQKFRDRTGGPPASP